MLHGGNLWMDTVSGKKCVGFYATRYIRAYDEKEAAEIAVDMVLKELYSSGSVLNEPGDSINVMVEEIVQLTSIVKKPNQGKGFTFYEEDDET